MDTAIELAVETIDGWLFLEEVESDLSLEEAAKDWAPQFRGVGLAPGVVVFGASSDPHSGHYETRVEIYDDGSCVIR